MDIVMRRFQITCPRGNQDHLIRRSGRVRTQPQDVGLSPPPTHGLTDLVTFSSRPSNNILYLTFRSCSCLPLLAHRRQTLWIYTVCSVLLHTLPHVISDQSPVDPLATTAHWSHNTLDFLHFSRRSGAHHNIGGSKFPTLKSITAT